MGMKEEKLWTELERKAQEEEERCGERESAPNYLKAVEVICKYGVDRAKTIRDTFPFYTMHDEIHICNVMRLMESLLGDEAGRLSRDETAMLIMAACCHDIGMSYSEEDKEELFEDPDRLNLYLDSHCGEYVKAYQSGSDSPQMTEDMIQDYLRSIHHERIRDLLCKGKWQEWPQVLNGRIEREDLISVCQSHGEDCEVLEKIEPSPHMDLRFCGILLRLADILDFDTSRAPETVYEYSGFGRVQSAAGIKSKEEWDKHIASNGFDFTAVKDRSYPYILDYSAVCKSMQVEQTVNCYLDWVDRELVECNQLLQKYNGEWQNFVLPRKINRRITSSGYKSGQYRLTLDQDQVMQLFTGENLYDDPAVFVRELIQNAIDAVRTRKQLDKALPSDWKGQIHIRCWMDEEGYHWFRIEDNGIGMTEDIIRNYFLKVGCSYYNSDEFAQEKLRCRADSDYTPISRFGIGILSCFMGDKKNNRVEVNTKHFNENGEYYPALRLSMHGINGYFYLADKKEGHMPGPMVGKNEKEQKPYLNQPGTVVAVRTNLFQTGEYRSFKDIVDKYVMYPEVKIHYEDDENRSCDYLTEKELMDEVHAFCPSDDPEKRGVLEIPIPEEEFQKLYTDIPELAQVQRPLPKILLKCIALDEYTESPYLNGIALIGKLERDLGSVKITVDGDDFPAVVKTVLAVTDGYKLRVHIALRYSENAIIKLRQLLNEVAPDTKFEEWDRTGEFVETVSEDEKIQCLNEYRKNDIGKSILLDIDGNYGKWMKKNRGDGSFFSDSSNVIAHNGILCQRTSDYLVRNTEKEWNLFALTIMLKDRYRPEGNISRGDILDFNLEAKCDFAIIKNKIAEQYCEIISSWILKNRLQPMNRYRDLLEKHPEWEERLEFRTVEGIVNAAEINERLSEGKELVLLLQRKASNILYDEQDLKTYRELCFTYLRMHYEVKAEFGSYDNPKICLSYGENSLPDGYGDYFPPFLFLQPLDKDFNYLTHENSRFPYFCNKEHRLSRFMLRQAKKLNDRTPGIFRKMIRLLTEDSGDDLIDNMNIQLAALQKLPGNPFGVTDSLYLTKDDLVCMK